MLFLKKETDYKTLVSGLRRELKEMGVPVASHMQMAELLARAMGHKTYAALKAAHTDQPEFAAPPVPSKPETYEGEDVDLEDDTEHKAYRLFNMNGELDLAEEGVLATGLRLHALEGTLDDILSNTANVSAVLRNENGELDIISSEGGTEVNWDNQHTRVDKRNVPLWWSENAEAISEDRCIVIPDSMDRETNILNEEVVEEYNLPVRGVLVDAAFRYISDKDLVAQALEEMPYENGFFEHEFYGYAEQLFNSGSRKASTLGLTQRATGFCMHVGEFKALRERLAALQQPPLF